jgi:hypothetical protein
VHFSRIENYMNGRIEREIEGLIFFSPTVVDDGCRLVMMMSYPAQLECFNNNTVR